MSFSACSTVMSSRNNTNSFVAKSRTERCNSAGLGSMPNLKFGVRRSRFDVFFLGAAQARDQQRDLAAWRMRGKMLDQLAWNADAKFLELLRHLACDAQSPLWKKFV